MRIVGVDPGIANSGYGLIEAEGNDLRLVGHGTIVTGASEAFPDRLLKIYREFEKLLDSAKPEVCCVESIFFAKNAKSAFQVGHARAVFMVCAAQRGIPVYEYTPPQVKKALVGAGRAEKEQVQYMVKALLRMAEIPKPDHAADALAVAICHANSIRFHTLIGREQTVYRGS